VKVQTPWVDRDEATVAQAEPEVWTAS